VLADPLSPSPKKPEKKKFGAGSIPMVMKQLQDTPQYSAAPQSIKNSAPVQDEEYTCLDEMIKCQSRIRKVQIQATLPAQIYGSKHMPGGYS